MTSVNLRPATVEDRAALHDIIRQSGLFSEEELPFLFGMADDHLEGRDPDRRWFVLTAEGLPAAAACMAPEALADGVRNILFLAVLPNGRRRGHGAATVRALETLATAEGVRLVLIETSSDDAQGPARALYASLGYACDGIVKGYYAEGTDKVIFRRTL